MFSGDLGDGVLQAYQPVLLQLSSTNGEQAAKGNGLKIRRVLTLAANVLHAFLDKFCINKTELELAQQRARDTKALSAMARSVPRCPLVCHVNKNAFCFHDASAHVIEICDSGVDSEMGCKLLLPESVLLQALLCTDVSRALRMLTSVSSAASASPPVTSCCRPPTCRRCCRGRSKQECASPCSS